VFRREAVGRVSREPRTGLAVEFFWLSRFCASNRAQSLDYTRVNSEQIVYDVAKASGFAGVHRAPQQKGHIAAFHFAANVLWFAGSNRDSLRRAVRALRQKSATACWLALNRPKGYS
jgi:hypothetical protein